MKRPPQPSAGGAVDSSLSAAASHPQQASIIPSSWVSSASHRSVSMSARNVSPTASSSPGTAAAVAGVVAGGGASSYYNNSSNKNTNSNNINHPSSAISPTVGAPIFGSPHHHQQKKKKTALCTIAFFVGLIVVFLIVVLSSNSSSTKGAHQHSSSSSALDAVVGGGRVGSAGIGGNHHAAVDAIRDRIRGGGFGNAAAAAAAAAAATVDSNNNDKKEKKSGNSISDAIGNIKAAMDEAENALDAYLAAAILKKNKMNMKIGGGGNHVAGDIIKVNNNDNSLLEMNRAVNDNKFGRKEFAGGDARAIGGINIAGVGVDADDKDDTAPISPDQLRRLKRQRDYLTVRYDRTSFTPYSPSVSAPAGAGFEHGSGSGGGGEDRGGSVVVGNNSSTSSSSPRGSVPHLIKRPHWHRRQWAIPHPRHNPRTVARRAAIAKAKSGGHRPATLVTPRHPLAPLRPPFDASTNDDGGMDKYGHSGGLGMMGQNGDNSIFVTIASYRDEQCSPTIHNMYLKAKFPENLYVGVVQQHDNDDKSVNNGKGDLSCIPPQFGRTIFTGGVAGGALRFNSDGGVGGGGNMNMAQNAAEIKAKFSRDAAAVRKQVLEKFSSTAAIMNGGDGGTINRNQQAADASRRAEEARNKAIERARSLRRTLLAVRNENKPTAPMLEGRYGKKRNNDNEDDHDDNGDNNNKGNPLQLSRNNPYSSWRNGGKPNGVGCQHDYGFCPTDNIRIRHILPKHCKGPTFGRYVGFLMYRGEQFVFMMDSHNRFVTNWDVIIISMHNKAKSDLKVKKPVLSHYPEAWSNPDDDPKKQDRNPSLDGRKTTAYLCKANFLPWGVPRLEAIVVHGPQRVMPQPWAAAGFMFGDGALVSEVPFDPFLDYVFDGEEVTYSVRMWTHGWNIFSPTENVIYHYYYRKSAKRFWGLVPANWGERKGVSERRIQYLLQTTPVDDPQHPTTPPPTAALSPAEQIEHERQQRIRRQHRAQAVADLREWSRHHGNVNDHNLDSRIEEASYERFLVGNAMPEAVRVFYHDFDESPYRFKAFLSNASHSMMVDSQGNLVDANGLNENEKRSVISGSGFLPAAIGTLPPNLQSLQVDGTSAAGLRHMRSVGRYGMGSARTVADWWAFSGMKRRERKVDHIKFCATHGKLKIAYDED